MMSAERLRNGSCCLPRASHVSDISDENIWSLPSVANASDLAGWIGAKSKHAYNFHPSARPEPLQVRVRGFDVWNVRERISAMRAWLEREVAHHTSGDNMIVFVASKRLALLAATDIFGAIPDDADSIEDGEARTRRQVQDPAYGSF